MEGLGAMLRRFYTLNVANGKAVVVSQGRMRI